MEFSLLLPIGLLVVLLLLGMPVAISMLIAGILGLTMTIGFEGMMGLLQQHSRRHTATYTLTAIPMFILMAEFLGRSRITGQLFDAGAAWLSSFRGGLAMATVGANGIFAAMSGSTTAAASSMARLTVPEMRRQGYDERLSLGVVACAGTIAAMIPPSISLIVFGTLTETPVDRLFLAGFIPGIITVAVYFVVILVWVRLKPGIAPKGEPAPWSERFKKLLPVWPALLLIVLVLGGIYSGVVTTSEAGAFGASCALVLAVVVGGLRLKDALTAIKNTLQSTGMILLIIVGAGVFGVYLTTTQVTQTILRAVSESGIPPFFVMIFIVTLYLILGTFMDSIAMMVLTLPLTFPLMLDMGYNAIWFGILVVKLAEIGLITPPFGMNAFVTAGSIRASVAKTFAGSARFLIGEAAIIVILIAFPIVVTFLPDLVRG